MRFNYLQVEGFRSWKETTEFVFNKGVTHIGGRNGVGKTSIVEALCYCLYGKTFKKSSDVTNSNCLRLYVRVNFTDHKGRNVSVTRIEYRAGKNEYELYIDGTVTNFANKSQFDSMVADIVGMSFEAFTSAIIIPQRGVNILYSPPAVQRSILEEIFNTGWVEDLKAQVVARLSTISSDMSLLENSMNEKNKKVAELLASKELVDKVYQANLNNFNDNLTKWENDISDIKHQISDLENTVVEIPELVVLLPPESITVRKPDRLFIDNLNRDFEAKKTRLKVLVAEASAFNQSLQPCPSCGFISKENEAKLEQLRNGLVVGREEFEKLELEFTKACMDFKIAEDEYKALEEKHKDNSVDYNAYLLKKVEHSRAVDKAESIAQRIRELEDRLKKTCEPIRPTPPDHGDTNKIITSLLNEFVEMNALLEKSKPIYDSLLWWNKQLSVAGLKEYIFSQSMEVLSKYMEPYLLRPCTLSYQKGALVVTLGDSKLSFGDLSGGEQQLIELAITFAIHDMVSGSKKSNLIFLDEPFTNMDSEIVMTTYELLRSKAECVYLITHTPFEAYGVNKMSIIKENGVSRCL